MRQGSTSAWGLAGWVARLLPLLLIVAVISIVRAPSAGAQTPDGLPATPADIQPPPELQPPPGAEPSPVPLELPDGLPAGAPPPPAMIFPFPEEQRWLITCGYADGTGCQHGNTQWTRFSLDFASANGPSATRGQPVRAAAAGTVNVAGWGGDDSYGWYVTIGHGQGYETLYAHMERAPDVAVGQIVAAGETLGATGSTGRATGPHIHFTLLYNGTSVRPEPVCGFTGLDDGQVHTNCRLGVPASVPGAVDCDGVVNSVDALLVLQFQAALIAQLLCPEAADVNLDGAINAIDAFLILQFDAGLILSPTPGAWNTGAPMPAPRTEVTSAAVDGVIYVIGGFTAAGQNSDLVQAYDTATNTWSTVAPLPVRVDHAGAAAIDGKIYVVGGYRSLSSGDISAATYVYDPATNAWSERAPMPLPRAAAATVALEGKVYVFGGVGPDERTPLAYDPASDTWEQLTPMSEEREHLAAAALDGLVYVVGGRRNVVNNVGTLEVYDPASDAWSAAPPMPTARGGLAAAVLNGRVHVFGGEDLAPGGATYPAHELYDVAAGVWRKSIPLPTPRHGLTAQEVGGKLYVIGGGPTPRLSVSGAVEVFSIDE